MSALSPQLTSSKRIGWCTPQHVLDLVRRIGPIGLDPCSSGNDLVGARRALTSGGLTANWLSATRHNELIYVNPPYGRGMDGWVAKCASVKTRTVIALLPARTDRRLFHEHGRYGPAGCRGGAGKVWLMASSRQKGAYHRRKTARFYASQGYDVALLEQTRRVYLPTGKVIYHTADIWGGDLVAKSSERILWIQVKANKTHIAKGLKELGSAGPWPPGVECIVVHWPQRRRMLEGPDVYPLEMEETVC